MENILNLLKEEIRKVTSEDKIDTAKLTELLCIYRRIEAYTITSVSQIHSINPAFDPYGYGAFPAPPPAGNETVTMYDQIIKAAQEMYKAQTPNVSANQITRYIDWYKFLIENKANVNDDESFKLRQKLLERILNNIEKELAEKDKKDEVKEKLYEHIVDSVKKEIEKQKEE